MEIKKYLTRLFTKKISLPDAGESCMYPKLENVFELRGSYKFGTVPDKVLFLTAAIDVQQGSKNDPNNPPRLEMEVKGHGAGYRTWSIIYKVFPGEVKVPLAGAWEELNEYAMETGLIYRRKDGFEFKPVLLGVDVGDGTMTDAVYRFTETWELTYPISGFKELVRRKKEAADEAIMRKKNLKRFRLVDFSGVLVYEININYYKHSLYNSLSIQRKEFGPQSPGFCDFPQDYPKKYFEMLTAEDKLVGGEFRNIGRQNHSLNMDIYNRCFSDIYLTQMQERLRGKYKKQYTPEELRAVIDYKFVLKYLSQQAGVKYE